MPKLSLTRHLTVLCAAACLLLAGGAGAAQAATAGVLPPHNPASDCTAGDGMGIAAINACRAQEGVGPLVLPRNWSSLTPTEQGFVLINLERVNRGLPAIVGLSGSLNSLAAAGASGGADPSFPAGNVSGGGIWAGAYSVFGADYMWMYVDGPGGNNLDCTSAGAAGCWGHRDIMLWDRSAGPIVSGGGFASAGGTDSFAYLVLTGYSTSNLTFTWAGELKYFGSKPGVEPLGKQAKAQARRHRKHHRRHRAPQTPSSSGSASSTSSTASSASGPTITVG